MTGRQLGRRGVSVVMMLALLFLLTGLAALAAIATTTSIRLARDERRAVESWLVAATALAETRVAHRGQLDSIADGERLSLGTVLRPDGWRWRAEAVREGALIRLEVQVERRLASGDLEAARRLTLLLGHPPSDTVRVLAHRARM